MIPPSKIIIICFLLRVKASSFFFFGQRCRVVSTVTHLIVGFLFPRRSSHQHSHHSLPTFFSRLEDIRDSLAESSYGRFLADHAGKLEVSNITDKMNDKLASEFFYIRCMAGPLLAKFMDFITYEYMIENVMLILKAASTGRTDVVEIMEQCHPLGRFDENTMRSIASFENTPEGHKELYHTVLVETPIGKYFERYLIETKEDARRQNEEERQQILNDESTTILEMWLTKLYLEDFYYFCQEVGGDTALVMGEILETRADTTAISITLNSFGTPLNEGKTTKLGGVGGVV